MTQVPIKVECLKEGDRIIVPRSVKEVVRVMRREGVVIVTLAGASALRLVEGTAVARVDGLSFEDDETYFL